MIIELNGFSLELSLLASRDGSWIALPLAKSDKGFSAEHKGVRAELILGQRQSESIPYTLRFQSSARTRLRL